MPNFLNSSRADDGRWEAGESDGTPVSASHSFLLRCVWPIMRSAYSRLHGRGLPTTLNFNANPQTGDERCLLSVARADGRATLEVAILTLDGTLVTRQSQGDAAVGELTRIPLSEPDLKRIVDEFIGA